MTTDGEPPKRRLRDLLWAPGCFVIAIYCLALTRTTRSQDSLIAQLAGWAGFIIFLFGGLLFLYVEWLRWRRRKRV